jgi:hypothetical protein
MPGQADEDDRDDQDRAVSRRVRNPTAAETADEAAYAAAGPLPDDNDDGDRTTDGRQGGVGTASTDAAEDESEPRRSE